jgi:large subunit ribosomal protein L15
VRLNDLKPAPGSKKTRKRVGRGLGSGRGKTAGRGQKGQKSRSGFSQGAGWEGGRSRLVMRLPKRGFTRVGIAYQLVNLVDLNVFEAGATVDREALRERGVIRHAGRPIKLLGNGELEVEGLTVAVDACSRAAARAVGAAGGTVLVPAAADAGDATTAGDAGDATNAGDAGDAGDASETEAAPEGATESAEEPETERSDEADEETT